MKLSKLIGGVEIKLSELIGMAENVENMVSLNNGKSRVAN